MGPGGGGPFDGGLVGKLSPEGGGGTPWDAGGDGSFPLLGSK